MRHRAPVVGSAIVGEGGPATRRFDFVVAAVIGLGTAVAYFYGADRSLDYDGSVTVGNFVATADAWRPFRHQIVYNNHPLFSFAEHLVYRTGGRSELALLAVPVFCGAAGAAVLAGWAAARFDRVVGVSAGLLLAAN